MAPTPSPSPPYTNAHTQDEHTLYSTPIFRPASRRTPSFSSSSRSTSWGSSFDSPSSIFHLNEDNFPPYDSPKITTSTPLKFKGRIPFSWEQIPGIPKFKVEQPSGHHHLLPLPPAGNSTTTTTKKVLPNQEEISPKKSHHMTSNMIHRRSLIQRDPFFAALVECSKDDDDDHHGSKNSNVTRSLSDRFGFLNMYVNSCKKTCAVSESIVYLPSRSSPNYLLRRR